MSTLEQGSFEDNKVSFMPIALRYGLIGTLVLIGIELISKALGYTDPTDPSTVMVGYITWALNIGIIITTLILAVREFRAQIGGTISFGRAFVTAFVTGLMIAVISMIWTYLNITIIDPSTLDIVKGAMEEQMAASGAEEEAIGMMSWVTNPYFISGSVLLLRTLSAAIFGLVAAAVLQNDKA